MSTGMNTNMHMFCVFFQNSGFFLLHVNLLQKGLARIVPYFLIVERENDSTTNNKHISSVYKITLTLGKIKSGH